MPTLVVGMLETAGAMPTLAVGMLETWEYYDMPTASVGMAPFPSTFRNRNHLGRPSVAK